METLFALLDFNENGGSTVKSGLFQTISIITRTLLRLDWNGSLLLHIVKRRISLERATVKLNRSASPAI